MSNYEEIIEYLKENKEEAAEILEAVNRENGFLYDDIRYNMGDLDEELRDKSPVDIINMARFGLDADNWYMESGVKKHGQFNPNKKYFYYNGYGNLVSTDYKDYSDIIDSYVVNDILWYKDEIKSCVHISSELMEMLEELEEEE